jgi:hypothetical protein
MRKSPALLRRRFQGEKSWTGFFLSALPVLLAGVFTGLAFFQLSLSSAQSGPSPLVSHVAARYMERGVLETGQAHPVLAVFSDYRSFDLALLTLLYWAASWVFLGFGAPAKKNEWDARALWSLAGPGLVWGLGLISLFLGSDFLDYEVLRLPLAPSLIRPAGAALAVLGLLAAAAFLFYFGAQKEEREG